MVKNNGLVNLHKGQRNTSIKQILNDYAIKVVGEFIPQEPEITSGEMLVELGLTPKQADKVLDDEKDFNKLASSWSWGQV